MARFRRYKAWRRYGTRSTLSWARKRYVTRKNAIASTPYLAGAAIGFTGIVDKHIPSQFQNVLMVAAVAPPGIMKGRALGTLKAVAQGYVIGRVVKGITGFGGLGNTGGNGGNVI